MFSDCLRIYNVCRLTCVWSVFVLNVDLYGLVSMTKCKCKQVNLDCEAQQAYPPREFAHFGLKLQVNWIILGVGRTHRRTDPCMYRPNTTISIYPRWGHLPKNLGDAKMARTSTITMTSLTVLGVISNSRTIAKEKKLDSFKR